MISLPAQLAKRDPYQSLPGLLLTGVTCTLNVLVPLLVVFGLTDSWNAAELPWRVGVAFVYGVFMTAIGPMTVHADEGLIMLRGSMATAQGLRRLIAWDRRWFTHLVDILLTTVYIAIGLLAFSIIRHATGNYPIPAGTQAS